jgi:hypothetical protein
MTLPGEAALTAGGRGLALTCAGEGSVAFEGEGITVLTADGQPAGSVAGGLPGTVTADLTAPLRAGGATGVQTFDKAGLGGFVVAAFGATAFESWDSGSETAGGGAGAGRTFTLFKLPAHAAAFPDNADGGQQYQALCASYGMVGIGCDSSSSGQQYGGMGAPSSWSCQIEGPMHSKTGWTNVAFFCSDGSIRGVNSGGSAVNGAPAGSSPVCALAH